MKTSDGTDEIHASVGRTILDAARSNELKIAYVRSASLLCISGLGWVSIAFPMELIAGHAAPRQLAFESGWCVAALALVVVLRRGIYSRAVQFAAPLVDALGLLCFYFLGAHGAASGKNPLYALSFGAALLVAIGGLKFSRPASLFATLVTTVAYTVIRLDHDPRGLALSVVLLLLCGTVSYWSAAHVRSVALSEASRLTLRRFLPAELVDASPRRALELVSTAKTVNATVLVSDLRGFTAMSETLPPARVLEVLNEVQGAFAAAVRARGGVVDKFMGDGMLAVFGAFQPMPDHCARALGAALDMRGALEMVNAARAARGEAALGMGIGVHAGPLIAGCLGSGARLEMTVIGDTVNIASRLEALTKEKGVDVLVSEDAALPSGLPTEPLGEAAVRGRLQSLRVHRLR